MRNVIRAHDPDVNAIVSPRSLFTDMTTQPKCVYLATIVYCTTLRRCEALVLTYVLKESTDEEFPPALCTRACPELPCVNFPSTTINPNDDTKHELGYLDNCLSLITILKLAAAPVSNVFSRSTLRKRSRLLYQAHTLKNSMPRHHDNNLGIK
jgi:hypothetical protein